MSNHITPDPELERLLDEEEAIARLTHGGRGLAQRGGVMTTYNVLIGVVDLVDADSEREAITKLRRRLLDAGFDTYSEVEDAFESEQP